METRLYEGMFLFDANLASQDWPGLEQHVQDLLKKHNAELVYSERWPDRKLAYEVRGARKGTYFLTYFRSPPDSIDALERDCQLSDRVLRVLVLYDKALEGDCQRRINKEVQGSPEEIEARREAAAAPAPTTTPAAAPAAAAAAPADSAAPAAPAAAPAAPADSAVAVEGTAD